jgi:hypothetical protein
MLRLPGRSRPPPGSSAICKGSDSNLYIRWTHAAKSVPGLMMYAYCRSGDATVSNG